MARSRCRAETRLAFPGAGTCDQIITAIAALDDAIYFLHPVDATALCLPDYFEIIKQPMDLETVRGKLDMCQYASVEAFARDVHLVFNNARKYNLHGTHVHSCATILQQLFTETLRKISGGAGFWSTLGSYSSPEDRRTLNALLDVLRAEPEFFGFLSPIDPVTLGVPDYDCTMMIRTVDLGAIRDKVSSDMYSRRKDQFIADVRFSLVNVISNNLTDDQTAGSAAKKLLAIFEAGLANGGGILFQEVNPMQKLLQGLIDALIAGRTFQNTYRPVEAAFEKPIALEDLARDVDLGAVVTLRAFQSVINSTVSNLTQPTAFACGHLATRGVAIARISIQPPPPVSPWLVSSSKKNATPLPSIPSNSTMRKTFASTMRKTFAKILSIIMADPSAQLYFNVPVDQVALAIPDYCNVIKRPIDLGTILSHVKQDHYLQARSFFDDVALVFTNAMVYNNKPAHPAVYLSPYSKSIPWLGLFQASIRSSWLQHT